MDTGCPDDLVSLKTMPPDCKQYIEEAETTQSYDTAHGALSANQTVDMQVQGIGVASPYVLRNTPDVLTIGRRCLEQGFSFRFPKLAWGPQTYSWGPQA